MSQKFEELRGPLSGALQTARALLQESIQTKQALVGDDALMQMLVELAEACRKSIADGGRVFFCGNGGSFADSIHLAAEFVSKLKTDRVALPAIALGTSGSNLTAIANDYGYQFVFSRELEALARPGDILIAISTSGNSPNILHAVEAAKRLGLKAWGWTGASGGKLAESCPSLRIPSAVTAQVQESHITLGHILCSLAEVGLV